MTFLPDTIYRDLMKSVHPDLHPEMKDATEKSQKVNLSKNDPVALRRLGIEWGFIVPTSDDFRNVLKTRKTTTHTIHRELTIFSVGDGIIFSSGKYVGLHGVIVNKDKTAAGMGDKYHGFDMYTIYIKALKSLVSAKIKNSEAAKKYFTKYSAGPMDIKVANFEWKKYIKNKCDVHSYHSMSDMGLEQNKKYTHRNIIATVILFGTPRQMKIIRTTKKMVVLDYYGIEKMVSPSKIINIKKQ